ncbi:NTP transferase domain-containing protein [Chromobacterium subtsugae]|mgnify:CR=1 FL=1|uniref:NTP transferase domain-containing protein n=1 Tax=Chromobacterium subtsugae TaxID=251747 RepID=A0ABS7FB82_9NEIS|nr:MULTISPECIES: NTP transferase domain-containing protein [Chromobacterium]MBW7566209.1 NTP transferase domain-containing protein [Chromobacterium subtsugae]MBW8287330.1 NTP transferase domain-containing protein [Chromobacterium subtsugae]WSE90478.1 NTP transferase domain-containing protein [Chromobacterium subtsugae]WVH58850.1 NTP transferase domain-containing protein [Chromobacterium subtsugae]
MIAGAMLAAGAGRRFGGDKRQAALPDGRTLLEASLQAFVGQVDVLAVALPEDDAFGAALCRQLGATPLACRLNRAGLGHSLACAAAWALALPQCRGLVLGLADMPLVRPHTVSQVAAALWHGRPVLPCYLGQAGHPRGLPGACLPALLDLSGDIGARDALDWSQALRLELDDAGVLLDIDTPEDLLRLA